MRHLAIFYTNNRIYSEVLKTSIGYFQKMIESEKLPIPTLGVIVSSESVSAFLNQASSIINIIAPIKIQNKGHKSIIEKILLAINTYPSNYISLHEHDVLYPENYLSIVQQNILEYEKKFDYFAYNNIVGVNKSGYLEQLAKDIPLSCLTFPNHILVDVLKNKRNEIEINKGWCYLEPGYAKSYGTHLKQLVLGTECEYPVIHINMNGTRFNHHFTNHYCSYEKESRVGFNEWAGDLSYIFC